MPKEKENMQVRCIEKKKDSTILDWLKECRRKKAEEIERLEKEGKKNGK